MKISGSKKGSIIFGFLICGLVIINFLRCAQAQEPGTVTLKGCKNSEGLEDCPEYQVVSLGMIAQGGKITRVEGDIGGFMLVRIQDGREEVILDAPSGSKAIGKEIPPGIYKVYPKVPISAGDKEIGEIEVCVRVYVALKEPIFYEGGE